MNPVQDPSSSIHGTPDDGTKPTPSFQTHDPNAAAAEEQQQDDTCSSCNGGQELVEESAAAAAASSRYRPLPDDDEDEEDSCVREKLKRHRTEVAGRVWIPEIWGQEELLKDWTDCSAFDAALGSNGIMSARDALVRQGLTTTTTIDPLGLSVGNSF
ncbi:Protein BIC1 [Linum perenne]